MRGGKIAMIFQDPQALFGAIPLLVVDSKRELTILGWIKFLYPSRAKFALFS